MYAPRGGLHQRTPSGAFTQSPLDGADARQRRGGRGGLWGRWPMASGSWFAAGPRRQSGHGDRMPSKGHVRGDLTGAQAPSAQAGRCCALTRRARHRQKGMARLWRHAALVGGARLCSGKGLRMRVGWWHAGQIRTSTPVRRSIKARASWAGVEEASGGRGPRSCFAATRRVVAWLAECSP